MSESNDLTLPTLKKHQLYSHEIKELIKKAVMNNELKPGERIVETRWAKKLGVSQAPVREAIRELIVMGLIESRPYQGAFVKEIKKQDIIDSYNVRMSLELPAMQFAAKSIVPEQLVELRTLIDEMKQAVSVNDMDLFVEKDRLFHYKILEISNNQLLIKLWEQCRIREYSKVSSAISPKGLLELAERHEILYECLLKRDEDTIAIEIRLHFELLIDELLDDAQD